MSYNKTSVIQLRELSGIGNTLDKNYINGQYENVIDEITINDGDEVSIKSCIIDSSTPNQGKVVIEDDETEFSITFNHYIKNYESANKRYNGGEGTPSPNQPDGLHYFLCDTFLPSVNNADCNSVTFTGLGVPQHRVDYWGNYPIVLEYTPAGQVAQQPTKFVSVLVPSTYVTTPIVVVKQGDGTAGGKALGFAINDDFPVFISKNPKYNNEKTIEEYFIDTSQFSFKVDNKTGGTHRSPHDFTLDFTIPAGTYDPDELARIITNKTTLLRPDESNFTGDNPMNNPMLTTNKQFFDEFPHLCPDGHTQYVSETGENMFDIPVSTANPPLASDNVFSGTAQFGLQFDESVNKFKLVIINNAFYESGNISVKSVKRGVDNEYYLVNKTSGVTIKNMSPPNVWFKKMGLNPNILITSNTTHSNTWGTNYTNQVCPVFVGLEEGVNTTGSYKGLDMVVIKNGDATNPNGAYCPNSSVINDSTIIQNIIYAEKSIIEIGLSYGYFLIDISMGIEQEFKGFLNKNTIQGVVGRYYSTNSFTTAYNEGSIPYVHRGQSIKLSKFRVKILNDVGEFADDIGNNNTIFLEINRNITAPNQTEVLSMPLQDFLELKKNQKK